MPDFTAQSWGCPVWMTSLHSPRFARKVDAGAVEL